MFPSSQCLLAGGDTHSHHRTQLLCQPGDKNNCCAATDHSSGRSHFHGDQDLSDRVLGSLLSTNEPSSMCLRAMVEEYMEGNVAGTDADAYNLVSGPVEATTEPAMFSYKRAIQELESILKSGGDEFTKQLREHVVRAVDELTSLHPTSNSPCHEYHVEHNNSRRRGVSSDHMIRRVLVKRLRKLGYKAGICKTIKPSQKGGAVNGLPPDEHEYVDVLVEDETDGYSRSVADGRRHSWSRSGVITSSSKTDDETKIMRRDGKNVDRKLMMNIGRRVIIEVSMRDEFRVARPCEGYGELLQAVPVVFVGGAEALRRLVRVMAQAARASLEAQGMLVPPWRSLPFMLAKWLSPSYHRTTTTSSSSSSSPRQRDLPSLQTEYACATAPCTANRANDTAPLDNIPYNPASSHHHAPAARPMSTLPPALKTTYNTHAADLPATAHDPALHGRQSINAEPPSGHRLFNTSMQAVSTSPSHSNHSGSSKGASRKVAGALSLALQMQTGLANHHLQHNSNDFNDRNMSINHHHPRTLRMQPDPFPRHCSNPFVAAR